jgi:hypothetical protein
VRAHVLATTLALASVFFGAARAADGNDLSISLLTFAPGEVYWQRFGHNALLVRNERTGVDTVYNYGMFDFRQKNFFLNFARGRMQYHLSALPLDDTLWIYDEEGRGIVEQALNLTPPQREALDAFLRWNALPENAPYRYDYFLANCSTRLRDAIDKAIDGELRRQIEPIATSATFRSEAVRLISPDRGWMLGMDLGLGPLADRPISLWERSFVPASLQEAVRRVQLHDGHSLVSEEKRLLDSRVPPPPEALPDLRATFAGIGLGLAALITGLAFARRSGAGRLAFAATTTITAAVFGLMGVILCVIWGLTDHWAGARSANLLQFSPLWLLLVPSWLRSHQAAWKPSLLHRNLAVILAAISLLGLALSFWGYGAAARHWIFLSLPVVAALALASFKADAR